MFYIMGGLCNVGLCLLMVRLLKIRFALMPYLNPCSLASLERTDIFTSTYFEKQSCIYNQNSVDYKTNPNSEVVCILNSHSLLKFFINSKSPSFLPPNWQIWWCHLLDLCQSFIFCPLQKLL